MIKSKAQWLIHKIDMVVKPLIIVSLIIYIIELMTGATDTYSAGLLFLWSERIVACIFTLEYLVRWYDDLSDNVGWHYPHSALGIVDLISILPFWIGFFVPVDYLHLIRSFRVFRILKFFRYSRSLQLLALGFYRSFYYAKPLLFSLFIISLFCTISIFEAESLAQPDKFATLGDSAYFTMVTIATVGYGDISPVTPFGRCLAIFTFMSALIIFAGVLGIVGNTMYKVLEEEYDPNIDPLEEFKKEKERILLEKARQNNG